MIKYAVYPGSVVLRDGTTATFTASQLAAAYGVSTYLTINTYADIPKGIAYFEYIHLKPRADDTEHHQRTVFQEANQSMGEKPGRRVREPYCPCNRSSGSR